MKDKIVQWVRQEAVLVIAAAAALLSMIAVPPSMAELAVLDYASERLLLPITCRFNYVMMRHNHYIPCLILTL